MPLVSQNDKGTPKDGAANWADLTFWGSVYELRKNRYIPYIWKKADLRPYLQRPDGKFSPNAINSMAEGAHMSRDGKTKGDYVKRRGISAAKVYKVQPGQFQLINDPHGN